MGEGSREVGGEVNVARCTEGAGSEREAVAVVSPMGGLAKEAMLHWEAIAKTMGFRWEAGLHRHYWHCSCPLNSPLPKSGR